MDHEFFTHSLETSQVGWDWLSIQLADHSEIMLYQIRRKDGSVDPYSSGTYTDAHGKSTPLTASDFILRPDGETWRSPITSANYPIRWSISIPKFGIALEAQTDLKQQEISGQTRIAPSYWEGAIRLTGHKSTETLEGVGYLEMTGYDRPIESGEPGRTRYPLMMLSSAALFLMTRVEPITCRSCFFRKSASKRVTVSRDEPII